MKNNKVCPNCENSFKSNFEFCPHCGQKNKEIKLAKKYEKEHKLSISERKLCLDNESSKYLKMTSSTIKKHFNDIKSLLKDGNYKKI